MVKFSVLTFDVWCLLKLAFWKVLTSVLPHQKDLWLICERGTDARDNGKHLFLYIKREHPEINCKYIISTDSLDINNLAPFQDSLVAYRSWRHFKALAEASHLISTHIGGCLPDRFLSLKFDRRFNLLRKKIVFLQHGITKDNLPALYASQTNLNLFVCGAKPEYEYISNYFGYSVGVVQYTGLCRFDALKPVGNKKQILIMPTWRKYVDRTCFSESTYFKQWKELLEDKRFHELLRINVFSLVFYLHHEFQDFTPFFRQLDLPSEVLIADNSSDVQCLLKESSMLITDYSSVYFDMLYMNKPVVFYQFDQDEFWEKHYQKGYIDESALGPVCTDVDSILKQLTAILSQNCEMSPKYSEEVSKFFLYQDNENCSRVFNAIYNL